ncbi:glycerol dehydrogenase [Swingsia samuiensis]|uniref:Glycerol dehydrogenase n=1 Tax=Swingsia samuiensis TaxID=1293412 RepID=A0A4Y6UKW7_9PROT|nr:glycerol dehydrogenase [Swingsia samuiensis]QDH17017.1 glycerol dehydrogenase [Swingsia samuiensis]
MPEKGSSKTLGWWLVLLLGVFIFVTSVFFIRLGGELAYEGGTTYYIICGVLLLVSSVLTVLGRVSGALLYFIALIYTWIWAFYEIGLDANQLMPRVFGPTLIGILFVFALPALRRMQARRAVKGTV